MSLILLSGAATARAAPPAEGASPCPIRFVRTRWCAALTWVRAPRAAEAPTEKDAGAFDLVFSSPAGRPAKPPGDLAVRLWMPEMGHGSLAPEVHPDPTDPARYHVRRVLFSMAGVWEIRLELRGARLDRAKLDYRYAAAP